MTTQLWIENNLNVAGYDSKVRYTSTLLDAINTHLYNTLTDRAYYNYCNRLMDLLHG